MAQQNIENRSLDEIIKEYIEIGIEHARVELEQRNLNHEIEQLLQEKLDLENRANVLERFDRSIKNLNSERGNIKPLAFSERADHEEKIMSAKTKKEKEIKKLHMDYRIKPDEISDKWQEVDQKITQAKSKFDGLPEKTKVLKEKQQKVGQEYKSAHDKDSGKAKEPVRDGQSDNPDKSISLSDRMAAAKAENELKKMTEPEKGRENTQEHGRERK